MLKIKLHIGNSVILLRCKQLNSLHELCDELKQKGAFAVDTETTGLQPLEVELVGISFCC